MVSPITRGLGINTRWKGNFLNTWGMGIGSTITVVIRIPKRVCIADLLLANLKRINGGVDVTPNAPGSPYTFNHNVFGNVFRILKTVDETSDYPTISFAMDDESRVHYGDGEKFGVFSVIIRGYIYSNEDSVNSADDLASDIEYIVETLNFPEHKSCEIVDIKTISTETDDGLFRPLGLCQLEIQIVYEQYDEV